MITLEVMGLEDADGLTEFMRAALGEFQGCYYRGATREPDDSGEVLTNAQVISRLADPAAHGRRGPRRDLRNMSDKNAAHFGETWKAEIDRSARSFVLKGGGGKLKKPYRKKEAWELAKIAAGRAWRKAGQEVMTIMHRLRARQLTTDDKGNESPADPVSMAYAIERQKKYGVAPEKVYIATGQLMEDLSPDVPGRIQLVKGQGVQDRKDDSEFWSREISSAGKAIQSIAGLGTGKMFK